jgi:uroporphyrin-III C-methyltransferase/precorrin-2 dehydrogenase/sirohydrochlorin ferrochelatase
MVFPLFVDLAGRRVVVVGGGRVATRRVLTLLQQQAVVHVVSPVLSDQLRALVSMSEITAQHRVWATGDGANAWLVVAATDDPEANAMVAAEATANRIWCVRSDDAEASQAWMAASGSFDDITVAVVAHGDPRRAVNVRDQIVAGLESGIVQAPRARERTDGRVTLVGAGPGVGLITLAGLNALRSADVVVTDRLVDQGLLEQLPETVEVIDAGKAPHDHVLSQEQINQTLVEHARAGRHVVRLKGGDPFVFGRGGEEVIACERAGVRVDVIPGVTSAIAAPAVAGIPVTHRGVATHFTVVSAASLDDFTPLASVGGTLVFLMGVAQLPSIVEGLVQGGMKSITPLAFIERAYLPGQRVTVSNLGAALQDAAACEVKNPAVIVVGDVVGVLEMART